MLLAVTAGTCTGRLRFMEQKTTLPRPLALASTFHESTRTAVSINRNAETGERAQLLTTSRLSLAWEGGELRVRCVAQRVVLTGADALGRPARRTR